MIRALVLCALTSGAAHATAPSEVVLLKCGETIAYQEVTEEFQERCRVQARMISIGPAGLEGVSRIGASTLVVTVGQEALDALLKSLEKIAPADRPTVVPTLAFYHPPSDEKMVGPPLSPEPDVILRTLSKVSPRLHKVGMIYGSRSESLVPIATQAAKTLGLTLEAVRVQDGPDAVRALRKLGPHVHALWLPPDSDVITPQVFQFALRLQLENGVPLLGATRQQVHSGALLAVDYSPRSAGRAAAELVNGLLDGQSANKNANRNANKSANAASTQQSHVIARITVSGQAARRLGVDLHALTEMGAQVE